MFKEPKKFNKKLWSGVWIIIPAYNEERTIRSLAIEALELNSQVIVVDDGSSDGTAKQLHGLRVKLLIHPINQGKAASLRTGFRYALQRKSKCVISLDGDGQHRIIDVEKLLLLWIKNPLKIIIGSRLHDRSQIPLARYRANKFACFWISWAAGHSIADSQSGFRAYPRKVMQLALSSKVNSDRFTFESEILIEAAKQGHMTLSVDIPGAYPVNSRPSHFHPFIDIAKIVMMVAVKLLQQGMAPLGLWRSLQKEK
jgi:glycosyltransferase involved in cell wall biosynthesis